MKEKITKLLNNQVKFKEAWTQINETFKENDPTKELFLTELWEACQTVLSSKSLESELNRLVEGSTETEYKNQELFKECQELSLLVKDNWDNETASLALSLYVLAGGELITVDPEVVLTLGELYGLDEKHTDHSEASPYTSKSEIVFLKDRLYPVSTINDFIRTVKYLEEKKETDKNILDSLKETAKARFQLDLELSESKFNATLPILTLKLDEKEIVLIETSSDTPIEMSELVDTIKASYDLTEDEASKVKTQLECFKSFTDRTLLLEGFSGTLNPLVLETSRVSTLVETLNKTKSIREYLLPLVGIVRQMKLSNEQIQEFTKGYSCFSDSVLIKLLESLPQGTVTEEETPTNDENPKVDVIKNPVAVVTEQPTKKTASLKDTFLRPSSARARVRDHHVNK
jgi:hypothetical protein